MGSRVIRVDTEVYAKILEVKARLEASTAKVCSLGDTLAFLVAMSEPLARVRRSREAD
jgi:hypothetical protein